MRSTERRTNELQRSQQAAHGNRRMFHGRGGRGTFDRMNGGGNTFGHFSAARLFAFTCAASASDLFARVPNKQSTVPGLIFDCSILAIETLENLKKTRRATVGSRSFFRLMKTETVN